MAFIKPIRAIHPIQSNLLSEEREKKRIPRDRKTRKSIVFLPVVIYYLSFAGRKVAHHCISSLVLYVVSKQESSDNRPHAPAEHLAVCLSPLDLSAPYLWLGHFLSHILSLVLLFLTPVYTSLASVSPLISGMNIKLGMDENANTIWNDEICIAASSKQP